MEIAPNIAVFGLTMYRITIPITVKTAAKTKALLVEILPAATGRFLVRSILASRSFSIIWLNAFDAPTIQYPPTASINKVTQLISRQSPTASKYPASVENTTLKAKPALVKALNSERIETFFIVEVVSKITDCTNEIGLQIYFKKYLLANYFLDYSEWTFLISNPSTLYY